MSLTGTGVVEMRIGAQGAAPALDITPFARSVTWVESAIKGGFSWSVAFDTEQWTDWKDFLLGAGNEPRLLRITSQEAGRDDNTTDWRTIIVDSSQCAVRGAALAARVVGGDRRLLLQQRARTRAWPARTADEIMHRIALEYDLVPEIDDTNVEKRDRWQCREDDWAFLRRTAGESATASGRGDAYLWVEERRLRYGAPVLSGASARRYDLAEVENRVDRTVLRFAGREIDRAGGATFRAVSYDLDVQAPLVFEVNERTAATLPALADRVPLDPDGGLRVVPVVAEMAAGVEGRARAAWGRAAPRYFALRVDTRPDLTIRPFDIVELRANLDARRNAPIFGRFVVLEVQHRVTRGAIRTMLACFRREAFAGEAQATGAAAQTAATRDRFRGGTVENARIVVRAENIE